METLDFYMVAKERLSDWILTISSLLPIRSLISPLVITHYRRLHHCQTRCRGLILIQNELPPLGHHQEGQRGCPLVLSQRI